MWQIGAEHRRRHEREAQERDERHRAQARLVAVVLGPEEREPGRSGRSGRSGADLINGSPEPVYRLVVAIVNIQGSSPRSIEGWIERRDREADVLSLPRVPVTSVSILPGGMYRVWIDDIGWGRVLSGRRVAEVAFTDRAGSHWVRRGTGELEELAGGPILHYLGAGPHELQTPERIA